MKPFDVLTLGALTIDVFVYSDAFRAHKDMLTLPLGVKLPARDIVFSPGGGASNAAATFANFGFRVGVQGNIGRDDHGGMVVNTLRRRGVATTFLRRIPRASTALAVILSAQSHERTVLIHRGASAHLSARNLVWPRVATRWLYVTSLDGNVRLLSKVCALAKKHRTPLCMNPGSSELARQNVLVSCLRQAAIVLLNREEANTLLKTRNVKPVALLQKLTRFLPGILVITDGASGAWCRAGSKLFHDKARKHLRVVERTGAGDAFGSGFLVGLLKTKGHVGRALRLATANAESVLTAIGAQNGLLKA